VKVFSYGFNLKMLKYIKRRRVDEEKDSENESKKSEPSTSKAETKWLIKKFAFTTIVLGDGSYTHWRRKLCIVCGKTVKYGCGTGEVKSTLHT
jgi:hypothetical protein